MIMSGFVIFGLTPRAMKNMDFLHYCNLDGMVQAFCTLNKELQHSTVREKPVMLWDEALKLNLPFFLAVEPNANSVAKYLLESSGSSYSENLINLLSTEFGFDSDLLSRQYCGFVHHDRMDKYYADAEDSLDVFWDKDSPFYRMFSTLDLSSVVELACGRGRHVEKYIGQAGSITLVDMLEKNISFCRERFSGENNITYYRNNGCDFAELKDSSYSALFSYDSMVHFEIPDIYTYLKETRRILRNGGCALFHHSNLMIDPKQSFYHPLNNGARTYMSKDLFAHLCYLNGLSVIDQQVIDWTMPEMDCITLVKK